MTGSSVRATKHLLLWTSLATFGLLAWAAFDENVLEEWRVLQRDYLGRLPAGRAEAFSVMLRQAVIPDLDATDRCVSCHVGMAPGEEAIPGDAVFSAHPDVAHDPAEYGCVVCHAGQGRATVAADAHGDVPHWTSPMIPRRYADAGCGACHTHLAVPSLDALRRGRALVERNDCLLCHRLDGRGGTLRPGASPAEAAAAAAAPDLSRVGAGSLGTGPAFDALWAQRHAARRAADTTGVWASFAPLPSPDLRAVEAFLSSRVGAPGLVEGKALFFSRGCLGCHKVHGVGGDDGPDLSRAGERDPGRTDFTHVPGDGGARRHGGKALAAWFAEHFRAPAAVVPGSQMPALGLAEEEIDLLVGYLFSLRRPGGREYGDAYKPNDRIGAERLGVREFSADGATIYGTFCAACHGARGEGMRYPGMPAFPAIAAPDFLALADDAFVRATVAGGRPGRRMPAWGEKEGGLRPDEIAAVVRHLREDLGGGLRAEASAPRRARGDSAAGERLYAENCAACHGARGEGAEGPALGNAALLRAASDRYLAETVRRGRGGTSMPSFLRGSPTQRRLDDEEIESIVTFIRTWEVIRR